MASIFNIFRKPKSFLGVDIGTSTLKLVEIGKEDGDLILKTYGEFKMPSHEKEEEAAFLSSILDFSDVELSDILKTMIKESEAKSRDISFSIPVYSSFFTVIEFPSMSKDELSQAINLQAQQHIPIPVSEVVIDWKAIEERLVRDTTAKTQVILVAVPKEIVNKYVRIAQLASLNLMALEVETFSLARALVRKEDKGANLLIDMGARNTNVSIVEDGSVRASHNFDLSGRDLTRAVSRSLGLNWGRAEKLKIEKGLEDEAVANILIPMLDRISSEIEKVGGLYKRRYGKEIARFFLAGGGSQFPGIEKYFTGRFVKEIKIGDPFGNIIYPSILAETLQEVGPTFSVAVGLALRELVQIV